MRTVLESNRELLLWAQKHHIHSEFKSNAAVLQSILFVYDIFILWEIKERTSKIKSYHSLFAQSHMTSDRTLLH